jgi:hypothetical protein
MARTLQNTIDAITPFCRYMAANIGTNNEPILSIATRVRNLMLAPPFVWRFNRALTTVSLSFAVQDYTQTISDLQFIEKSAVVPAATITNVAAGAGTATITAPNSFVKGAAVWITGLTNTQLNVSGATILTASSSQFTFASTATISSVADSGTAISGKVEEVPNILNSEVITETTTIGRPQTLCALTNDGAGVHKLRYMPRPDQQYLNYITYQKSPVAFASLSDGWAPVPDAFADIYDNLCLGYYMDSCQDPRGPQYRATGAAALLARAEGLDKMEGAIFLAPYLHLEAAQIIAQLGTQQGVQATGQK